MPFPFLRLLRSDTVAFFFCSSPIIGNCCWHFLILFCKKNYLWHCSLWRKRRVTMLSHYLWNQPNKWQTCGQAFVLLLSCFRLRPTQTHMQIENRMPFVKIAVFLLLFSFSCEILFGWRCSVAISFCQWIFQTVLIKPHTQWMRMHFALCVYMSTTFHENITRKFIKSDRISCANHTESHLHSICFLLVIWNWEVLN